MGKEIKNVIVLRNICSDMFEEVIFVLKKDAKLSKRNPNLVIEARKIVEDYINKNNSNYHKPLPKTTNYDISYFEKNKKFDVILNISLMLSLSLFVMLMIKLL